MPGDCGTPAGDIIYCNWWPGQWLKQVDLEAHYHALRSDVRDTLAEMLRLGLVEHAMNRGYRVVPADPIRLAENGPSARSWRP